MRYVVFVSDISAYIQSLLYSLTGVLMARMRESQNSSQGIKLPQAQSPTKMRVLHKGCVNSPLRLKASRTRDHATYAKLF